MSDQVIDIITKLTYQVEDKELQASAIALQKNIVNVISLTEELEKLQAQQKATAASDLKAQTDIQLAINKTTKAIDAEILSIEKVVKSNDRLRAGVQAATNAQKQANTVQNEAVKSHVELAKGADKADLALINVGRVVQDLPYGFIGIANNLNPLLESFQRLQAETGSSTSALKAMISSLSGPQGLGIILSIVSSLLVVFSSKLFDAGEEAKKTSHEIGELTGSLDKFYKEEFENVKNQTNQGSEALKRKLELIKANGVANGEVAIAEKNQFDASQDLRKSELSDLQNKEKLYKRIQGVLLTLRPVLTRQKGESLEDVAGRFEADRYAQSQMRGFSPELQQSVISSIKNGTLTYRGFSIELGKIAEEIKNKDAEITNDQVSYQRTIINRQTSLRKELIESNKGLSKEVLKTQVDGDEQRLGEQLLFIKSKIDIDRQAALHAVNLAQLEARKTGALNEENEELFNEQRAKINASYDEKYLQEKRAFFIKVQHEQEQYQLSILQTQLDFAKRQLGLDIGTSDESLKQKTDVAQQERAVAIDQLTLKYNELFRKATLGEADLTQVTKDYARERQLIEDETNKKTLQAKEENYKYLQTRADNAFQHQLNVEKINGVKQSKLAIDREKKAKAEADLIAANAEFQTLITNPQSTYAQIAENEKRRDKAKLDILDANKAIKEDHLNNVKLIEDAYLSMTQTIVNALNAVYSAQQKLLDAQITTQERRVDEAKELAERGNTEVLRAETERLNELDRQREQSAKKQIELNSLLQASNSAVALSEAIGAVVAAAAKGDPYTIALRVAAAVAALVAGVISLKSAFGGGFKKGGYTGDGNSNQEAGVVHKNEFVMNAEKTRQFRPLLEAMHSGKPLITYNRQNEGYATKKEMSVIAGKLDTLIIATEGNKVSVAQSIDKDGVRQMVETAQKMEWLKWK